MKYGGLWKYCKYFVGATNTMMMMWCETAAVATCEELLCGPPERRREETAPKTGLKRDIPFIIFPISVGNIG